MKTRFLIALLGLMAFCTFVHAQSVVVTKRTVTYKRAKPIMDFKKTFTVNYPRIRASSPVLSGKIENSLSYASVCDVNIQEEIRDIQWLEEADFSVKYNKNWILDVEFSIEGSGAYPSEYTRNAVVDLHKGTRVKPADVFTDLAGLASMIEKAELTEIKNSIAEIKRDPENKDENPEELFKDAKFRVSNLKDFIVSDKGVTFSYDYGFPHAILALQPDGKYFFAWFKLRPYIKRGGLLSRFVR